MDIKGKVAIVTGTSRGIGRRIAVELTRRGDVVALRARTVTPNRTIPGALGWTLDEILEAGGRAIAIPTKAVLNRLTKAIAAKLLGDNICAACFDPGSTRTELVDAMVAKGVFEAGRSHPMSWPVAVVMKVITAEDQLTFAGQVVRTGPPD